MAAKVIQLDVLLVPGTRTIDLEGGLVATATLGTDLPWYGKTKVLLDAPEGWTRQMRLPAPEYAKNVRLSADSTTEIPGYLTATTCTSTATLDLSFDLPVRLPASHPATGSGTVTVTVTRGPMVYVTESVVPTL